MNRTIRRARLLTGLLVAAQAGAAAAQDGKLQVKAPQPTVPEMFTIMGQYVRVAYNNEGFATLGYRMAQQERGEEWLMLQVGLTLRKPAESFTIRRGDLSLRTPDGKTFPLASQEEYAKASLRALNQRARVVRDSINYFPVDADRACALSFFVDLDSKNRHVVRDEVELTWHHACVGRLYFHVPGGIQPGQHWLDVKFANSKLEVPFRILTDEEAKLLEKNWQDIKKQHEEALGEE